MKYAIVIDGHLSSCSPHKTESFATLDPLDIPPRSKNVISKSSPYQIQCETTVWIIYENYPSSIHVRLRVWNNH